MNAHVIIGSSFGDCSKGNFTNFHSAKYNEDCVVIRFNGSCQASHTVELQDGTRHAFQHFGSGSFNGSPTFLSKYFIVNPIMFRIEYEELIKKGIKPRVYVDSKCMVTTPFDMLINQIVESVRSNKHGSCGLGVNEVITRHVDNNMTYFVRDIISEFFNPLYDIRNNYLPNRLTMLGVNVVPQNYLDIIYNDNIIDRYVDDCNFFINHVTFMDEIQLSKEFDNFVFEGAQGLLLDEDHYNFPHVTRSKTGLCNVIKLADRIGIDRLDVNYITRSYLTRHGAGPLPFEVNEKIYSKIEDKTNVPNIWQGSIRYAPLNLDLLHESICNDIYSVRTNIKIIPNIAMSCIDQLDLDIRYVDNKKEHTTRNLSTIFNKINEWILPLSYISNGPTKEDIY